jgi:RimJ/RimL family protein N-acetyltransferase
VSDADFRDGIAYLGVIAAPQFRRSGLVFEGVALALDYGFLNWNLRKIYAEMLEYNFDSVATGANTLFEIEARFRDHAYWGGDYWDLIVMTVTRDRWQEISKELSATLWRGVRLTRESG